MMKRALVSVTASLTLGLALAGCGGDDSGSSGGGDDLGLISSGSLTVCSDVPYPPFDTRDDDGTYTGFDGDIVNAIAKNLDLKVDLKDQSFDGLQSGLALNSNQCDMVAAAMTITDERAKNIDFSDGYYDSKQSLLVPAGSDIKSIDDLAGKKVGVQQGTTGKQYTEENAPDSAKVITLPSDAEEYSAIQAGQVDALLQDLPVNLEHTKDGKYEIVEQYDTGEKYGFGFRKDSKLVDTVDEQLQKMRNDGTYDKFYDKYFSTDKG